jgi:hypothetical protein
VPRRRSKVALALAPSFLALAATGSARAADMDPTPERLYLEPTNLPAGAAAAGWDCQGIAQRLSGANASTQPSLPSSIFPSGASPASYPCRPNNVAWSNLMSELGMAIAPSAFHPARTTGFGGFLLSFQATFTSINADATAGGVQYWHLGTRGPVDPNRNQFSVRNDHPDSVIQIYSLVARKGLPYGFEIGGSIGYVGNTSLWVGGADLRWALLEGYRTGWLGYVPDVSIGAGVRTVTGASSFYLTTLGIDGEISKPFTIGGSAVLTPYLGLQRIIIFADSAAVDLTPTVDPYQQCGWQGNNASGGPRCSNTLADGTANDGDFNNNTSFDRARIHRWRGLAGVNYRYEVLYLAGEFAMDLTEPSAENANLGITGNRQWTVALEAGVFF